MKKSGMAMNAGSDEVKKMAEHHGSGVGLSSKQHFTSEMKTTNWGSMAYSQSQKSDGSMNYMPLKEKIASSDAKKLMRSARKDV